MATPAIVQPQNWGREALRAANEADLLRDVLVREIRALGALFCVGRRRPISELTPEQQEKVREAYKDTLWSSDYGVDLMGICTSETLARKFCKERGENWYWAKLPIDTMLGDEPVFGEWRHEFPGSIEHEMYENMEAAVIAVPVSKYRAMEEEIAQYRAGIQELREEIAKLRKDHEPER